MNQRTYDVLIIGGGASGMMSAIVAARNGAKVAILEKNKRLGEKLYITGGGRCNILNAELDQRTLLKNYGNAEKFLYSAFTRFGVQESIDFFKSINIDIKIEARKRAIPVSEKASDVVRALEKELDRLGVNIFTSSTVSKIAHSSSTIYSVNCGSVTYKAHSYILSTGGNSRPETGSTGDGFAWLSSLGHSVKDPSPSITPIAVKGSATNPASGTTAKNIQISFYSQGKKSFRLDGDVLFTHFGLSGPLILNNAYRVADLLDLGPVEATIDFLPGKEINALDQELVNIFNQNGAKQVKNVISHIAPEGLGPLIRNQLKTLVSLDKKASEISRDDRKVIVNALKNFSLSIDHLMGADKAVVADGGVNLKEVDTRTFRSIKIDNLYITGDLLDINRPSGGYSLQLCWTTGYIAGTAATANGYSNA